MGQNREQGSVERASYELQSRISEARIIGFRCISGKAAIEDIFLPSSIQTGREGEETWLASDEMSDQSKNSYSTSHTKGQRSEAI